VYFVGDVKGEENRSDKNPEQPTIKESFILGKK